MAHTGLDSSATTAAAGGFGSLEQAFKKERDQAESLAARNILGTLVQQSQYVGEVYNLSYSTALVLIHDYHRQRVGGIPSLSFLVATRIEPDALIDYRQEDSSI